MTGSQQSQMEWACSTHGWQVHTLINYILRYCNITFAWLAHSKKFLCIAVHCMVDQNTIECVSVHYCLLTQQACEV